MTESSVTRETNFGIKLLFSIWYRYYKNLMKLYTTPGTILPNYNEICNNEAGCALLSKVPGFEISLTFEAIDKQTDLIMNSIYNKANIKLMSINWREEETCNKFRTILYNKIKSPSN